MILDIKNEVGADVVVNLTRKTYRPVGVDDPESFPDEVQGYRLFIEEPEA